MSEKIDIFANEYTKKIRSQEWKDFARGMRGHKWNFCEICKRSDVELQVHHWCYEKHRDLTDYKDEELSLLCFACHSQMHDRLREFRRYIFPRLTPRSFQVLNGALAVAFGIEDSLTVAYAIAEIVSTKGALKRLMDAWLKRPSDDPIVREHTRADKLAGVKDSDAPSQASEENQST